MEHIDRIDFRIARPVARTYANGRVDDDLESAAMLGLVEAAERWDESKGVPYAAYIRMRCSSRVVDELRRRARRQAYEVTTAPEDIPDTEASAYEITEPDLDVALTRLPYSVELEFRSGDIDRRRPSHRAALRVLREALT